MNPGRLGASLFSVGDLFSRLKQYKSDIGIKKKFFFVKVDVQAAYDNIPPAAVFKLISNIVTKNKYRISRHTEITPGENYRSDSSSRPTKRWKSQTFFADDPVKFPDTLTGSLMPGKKNTIFVENSTKKLCSRNDLLYLLDQHLRFNLVKIRNNYYRQKNGIPQGSVLSSLMCNFFYADLESTHLSFLSPEESLLLRLTDDFLLITTNYLHAEQFLQIMHKGIPSYGLKVSPQKSLVNFEAKFNGNPLPQVQFGQTAFPYCGCAIDTKNLDISRDWQRREELCEFSL